MTELFSQEQPQRATKERPQRVFSALQIAVLTVSDSRTPETDSSGDYLCAQVQVAGHVLAARAIVADNRYAIRAAVSAFVADAATQVVLLNGGTGFSTANTTVEAVQVLFDKPVEGFGEWFRQLSVADVGSSMLQSRAIAGLANGCLIAAMPGSTGACELAWTRILQPQLDGRTAPCNFVAHLKGGARVCG